VEPEDVHMFMNPKSSICEDLFLSGLANSVSVSHENVPAKLYFGWLFSTWI